MNSKDLSLVIYTVHTQCMNHPKPTERDWNPLTPTPKNKSQKKKTFSKQYTHGFSIQITKDCQQKF